MVALLAAGLVAIAGPSALIGDFRSVPEGKRTGKTAFVSASGSGRAQFWGTALEAFSEAPLKGIGAGSFESYWSRNGTLDTPARNAHSEPLEQLAELGAPGFACFAAFIVLVLLAGLRRARAPGGSAAGTALGVIVTGLIGFSIDWTWQVPAVVVPILIVAAVLTGAGPRSGDRSDAAGPRDAVGGVRSRPCPRPSLAAVLVLLAVPAIWAGGVLAIAASRLDASAEALGRGDLSEAAAAARSAAQIEPWAAEPWLRLTEIEQAAGNLEAAEVNAEQAIRRAPDDFGPWQIAGVVQVQLRNYEVANAYARPSRIAGAAVVRPGGQRAGDWGPGWRLKWICGLKLR